MIIVCQTIEQVFELVVEQLADKEDVQVVLGASDIIRAVRTARKREERTVVVTSNIFHEPKHHGLTGKDVARRVKQVDPDAWVFLYSTLDYQQMWLDGAVPKPDPVDNETLIRFVDARPDRMEDLDQLERELPWVMFY